MNFIIERRQSVGQEVVDDKTNLKRALRSKGVQDFTGVDRVTIKIQDRDHISDVDFEQAFNNLISLRQAIKKDNTFENGLINLLWESLKQLQVYERIDANAPELKSQITQLQNATRDFTELVASARDSGLIFDIPALDAMINKILSRNIIVPADLISATMDGLLLLYSSVALAKQSTTLENLDDIVGLLSLIQVIQNAIALHPSTGVPEPPPEDQPKISGVSDQISKTVLFIDGLIAELEKKKVVGPYLKQVYAQFRSEVITLTPSHIIFQILMAELQVSMENILFRGVATSAELQFALVTLWTQLIYLYNQVVVLSKLEVVPPSRMDEEGSKEADISSPPPPPPSSQRSSFLSEIEKGKTLKSVPKASQTKKLPEWQEKILEYTKKQNPDAREVEKDEDESIIAAKEWEEEAVGLAPLTQKDLLPTEDAKLPQKQVSLFSRISRRMESQLIGHPLFTVQSPIDPLVIALRLTSTGEKK